MDPSSTTTKPVGKEFLVVAADSSHHSKDDDISVTILPPVNPDDPPTIIIDPTLSEHDLSVTPAFPSFPTNEEIIVEQTPIATIEPSVNAVKDETTGLQVPTATNITRQSQQTDQLIDELKYLLRPTNSLATPATTTQASQEADSAIHHRTMSTIEAPLNTRQKLLIEGLTPREEKSLGAADRRSVASRGRASTMTYSDNIPRQSLVPKNDLPRQSKLEPNILIAQPKHRTFLDHLAGILWALLASYSFTIILFLTKFLGIDLVLGFCLQMSVQTVAFAVYAYYKGYNLLAWSEHRMTMISRSLLVGIGALTSYTAYYYIPLPELMAIRHSQIALTIILSIIFLHERITIPRIGACIATIGAVMLIAVPVVLLKETYPFPYTEYNKILFSRPFMWNYLIGMSLAICTALSFSITTLLIKNFRDQPMHNSVLCFWSASFALIMSLIFVYLTHFVFRPVQKFPNDWRWFEGVGLGVASIFVFIANQKAVKREGPSIVTLIYSTDIILALIIQNLFTKIKTNLIIILGCILILLAIITVCTEVLLIEKRKRLAAIKVAQAAQMAGRETDLNKPFISKTSDKHLSA